MKIAIHSQTSVVSYSFEFLVVHNYTQRTGCVVHNYKIQNCEFIRKLVL